METPIKASKMIMSFGYYEGSFEISPYPGPDDDLLEVKFLTESSRQTFNPSDRTTVKAGTSIYVSTYVVQEIFP